MGRNSAIKRFTATPAGQPLELFGGKCSRLPAIRVLLASPWIVRASDIMNGDGSLSARHAVEDVRVEWNASQRRPVAFTRSARRYHIDAILQIWTAEKAWWDPRRCISRRYWRVLVGSGVYDLAFDRTTGSWLLVGIHD